MNKELIDLVEKVIEEHITKLNMTAHKLAEKIVESINSAQRETPSVAENEAKKKVCHAHEELNFVCLNTTNEYCDECELYY